MKSKFQKTEDLIDMMIKEDKKHLPYDLNKLLHRFNSHYFVICESEIDLFNYRLKKTRASGFFVNCLKLCGYVFYNCSKDYDYIKTFNNQKDYEINYMKRWFNTFKTDSNIEEFVTLFGNYFTFINDYENLIGYYNNEHKFTNEECEILSEFQYENYGKDLLDKFLEGLTPLQTISHILNREI